MNHYATPSDGITFSTSDDGISFGEAQEVTGLAGAACDPNPAAYE